MTTSEMLLEAPGVMVFVSVRGLTVVFILEKAS